MTMSTITMKIDSRLKEKFTEIAQKQNKSSTCLLKELILREIQNETTSEEYEYWLAYGFTSDDKAALGLHLLDDIIVSEALGRR